VLNITLRIPASRAVLSAALEGLTAADFILLRTGNLPPLYQSGVRYKREPRGKEEWLTAPEVLRRRVGDCEDLAAWRAAELRLHGIPARAVAIRSGKKRFHAVVKYPDGSIEDPSRILGMKKRKR